MVEVAPREITVNAICPGWVDTEMAHAGLRDMAAGMSISYEEAKDQAMGMVPIQRILEPEEIAGLVCWMAGEGAAGMTAQGVSLCGGSTMV